MTFPVIAHEAVDRRGRLPGGVALGCVAKDGSVSELTYADLAGSNCQGLWIKIV